MGEINAFENVREYKSNIYSKCGHEISISLSFLLNEFEQKVVYVIFQSLCVSSYLSGMSKIVFLKIISSSTRIRDSYCFFPMLHHLAARNS